MIFIIPVKSSQISPSWARFSKLFERCLRSVCQQTDQDFKVIVVCNEKPIVTFEHKNIHFLYVDFPPPTSEISKVFTGLHSAKEADKSKKILGVDGWYSKSGYVYKEGSKLIFKKLDKFSSLCGTSVIVKPEYLKGIINKEMLFRHPIKTLDNGIELKPLPFPAAVYTINGENYFMNETTMNHYTGETVNNFKKFIERLMRYRIWFLTNRVVNNYGLYQI